MSLLSVGGTERPGRKLKKARYSINVSSSRSPPFRVRKVLAVMESATVRAGAADPSGTDIARAGAAAAARRRELGISQRSLAADGIVTAAALIAFEKGRSWPRQSTRDKLEEVLQWPNGAIERLRQGLPAVEVAAPSPQSVPAEAGQELSLVVVALAAAAHGLMSAVDALPPPDDPVFGPQITAVLADLRRLDSVAASAARFGTVTPALVKTLAQMRRNYDRVMQIAASAPTATPGQRLYIVRTRSGLTIGEAAIAAGVSEDAVLAIESEQPIPDADARALQALIEQLSSD